LALAAGRLEYQGRWRQAPPLKRGGDRFDSFSIVPFDAGLTMHVYKWLAWPVGVWVGLTACAGGVASAADPVFKIAVETGSPSLEWQVGAIFTGFWVLVAAAVAVVSRSSKRAEKPPKKEEAGGE
jgi:hypothetical protein